jgi:hypothetical protein
MLNDVTNIHLNLDVQLLSRIKIAAMMRSADPRNPMPWQNVAREALAAAFPEATETGMAKVSMRKGKR